MQQINCSNSSQFSEALSVYKAKSAVLGLCFVLGVPGNIAVLVMLVQRLTEKNFTLHLMLSLAMSDLLCLLPVPMWIWNFLNSWIFSSMVCKIISYFDYWCLYCSTLCVTLMSFQRYMQVLHPQRWATLGDKGQKGLLGGIWILSGLLASYAPITYDIGCKENGFQFCFQQFGNDAEKLVTLFLEILLFLICFFLLFFFYYRLHRGVSSSPFFRSSRMTKLVMRIIVVFFILYILVPIANVLIIIALFLNHRSLSETANLFVQISKAVMFLNSCVNPVLYAFSLKELQCCCAVVKDT